MANTWTIIRGRCSANIVRLGTSIASSAVDGPAIMDQQGRILVHSGDPIALLNDWTGGLLSVGNKFHRLLLSSLSLTIDKDYGVVVPGWSLNIITSSYQMTPNGAASTQDNIPDEDTFVSDDTKEC